MAPVLSKPFILSLIQPFSVTPRCCNNVYEKEDTLDRYESLVREKYL